jgi:hypothetical protein
VELPVPPDDAPAVKDGGRVEQPARLVAFRIADNHGDGRAGQRGQGLGELRSISGKDEAAFRLHVIGEPAQNALGAAEHLDTNRLASRHLIREQAKNVRGTGSGQRCLIRGNSHFRRLGGRDTRAPREE